MSNGNIGIIQTVAIVLSIVGSFWLLRADIADVRAQSAADIAALRAEVAADIAALREEIAADNAALRAEIAENRSAITDIRIELAEIKTALNLHGFPVSNKTADASQ